MDKTKFATQRIECARRCVGTYRNLNYEKLLVNQPDSSFFMLLIANTPSFFMNPYIGILLSVLFILLWPISVLATLENYNRVERIMNLLILGAVFVILISWILPFNIPIMWPALWVGLSCTVYYLYLIAKISLLMNDKSSGVPAVNFVGLLLLNFYWPLSSIFLQKQMRSRIKNSDVQHQ